MEYVGGVSGAALGYIHDNSRGAFIGWNYGYNRGKLLNNKLPKKKTMAPVGNNKRRKASSTLAGTPAKRRLSISSSSSRRSSLLSTGHARLRSTRFVGSGAGVVQVKGRAKKRKMKKAVSVSKKLREKIKKVISGNDIQGMTQEISYGCMRLLGISDNKQIVYDITTSNAGGENPFFSHIKVIDAASCLWNNKVQAETKALADIGNFTSKKLKVKVIDSSVTYNIKNNTQRKVNIRLLEVKPVSGQVQGSPFASWIAALNFQAAGNGPNQSIIDVEQLYTNPGMLPDFRKLFNIHTVSIEIPAGGEYKHYIQGPKDKLFDLQRAYNGALFQNYHKECVWLMAILIPDLVTTDGGQYGRYYAGGTDEQDYGVAFETITRYKMNMPEMTGLVDQNPAAGTTVEFDQRQFSYAFKTYGLTPTGTIISVNDENPVQNVAAP